MMGAVLWGTSANCGGGITGDSPGEKKTFLMFCGCKDTVALLVVMLMCIRGEFALSVVRGGG